MLESGERWQIPCNRRVLGSTDYTMQRYLHPPFQMLCRSPRPDDASEEEGAEADLDSGQLFGYWLCV